MNLLLSRGLGIREFYQIKSINIPRSVITFRELITSYELIIFFGLFTPVALVMRISGRDELRLKLAKKSSHWILREEPMKSDSFKHQF